MKTPYHIKVNRSLFNWGFVIPQEYYQSFIGKLDLKKGSSISIKINFDGKTYKAVLMRHKTRENLYRIIYSSNKELLDKLRKTFIYSYALLEIQKWQKEKGKFRSKLRDGEQGILKVIPEEPCCKYKFEKFIAIEKSENELFKEFLKRDLFSNLKNK